MIVKRNFLYSIGASLLLIGAFSAWRSVPGPGIGGGSGVSPIKSNATAEATLPVDTPVSAANAAAGAAEVFADTLQGIYREMQLEEQGLKQEVFRQALTGFYNLKARGELAGDKPIISIVDFARPSTDKRLWIIDLEKKKLLFRTLVAHGKGSGAGKATRFSNRASSHQSSLGFYITGEVYYGKHGRSLRLDGMDPGFNSNARRRAIVLHGAGYVSQDFIERVGRLGRSFGCPAVPIDLSGAIIDHIAEETMMFIHGPGTEYRSDYLNVQRAARYLVAANG